MDINGVVRQLPKVFGSGTPRAQSGRAENIGCKANNRGR